MKRCIICGHVGSDDSTVCEVCGNPYLDIRESDYSTEEDEQMDDADVVYEEDAAAVEDTYKAGNDEQEDAGTDFVQETAKESTQTENVNAEDHTAEAEYEPLDAFEASEEEDLAYVPQRKADEPDDAGLYEVPRMQEAPEEEAVPNPDAETGTKQAAPLRGEPHIYGQGDVDRSGKQRMTSGAIRREMGRAYEGSRADAPAGGRPDRRMSANRHRCQEEHSGQGVRKEEMQLNGLVRRIWPVCRRRQSEAGNGRRPVQAGTGNGGRAPQAMEGNAGRPMQAANGRRPVQTNGAEYVRRAAGSPNGSQGAANRGPAAVRPVENVQGGPVNMQNRPAGAYANAARPVNYAAQRLAMTARGVLKSAAADPRGIAADGISCGGGDGGLFETGRGLFSQAARLLSNVNFPAQMAGYMNSVLNVISRLGSGAIVANLIPAHSGAAALPRPVDDRDRSTHEERKNVRHGTRPVEGICDHRNDRCMSCTSRADFFISVAIVVSAWVAGTKSVIAVSVIVLILLIVVTMLVVMYYFSYLATLKTFRKNANGEVYGTASGYVAVIHIIAGLLGIISLLSGIVNAEIGTIIGAAGQIGWMVLFGVWIFQYRTKLSGEEE